MPQSQEELLDRFEGTLLGTAVGDALGMPVEGLHPFDIEQKFDILRDMADGKLGCGVYTDDTEMMIGLAESLIRCGKLDEADLARSFSENFHSGRGYGEGTAKVLQLIRNGIPWHVASQNIYPGGSYGNGSVMRIAPLAALYFNQMTELRDAAYAQSNITHAHPLAREGSYLQALAIALLIGLEKTSRLERLAFLAKISEANSPETPSFSNAFEVIETFLRQFPSKKDVLDRLGHDSRVIRSQPTALYAFLSHPDSFEEAVIYAVNLGGDADTIGAMTGALAGAYHGAKAIPERWLNALENKEKGREYIRALAHQLLQKNTSKKIAP